ncbi:PREDICTED: adhesion G protein-coupled receptor F5-like [Nanorana parkeri]|uniref:adhesion G protein-coupled receptor F5-like n=1 Tax=Nanorana parkeri TaxID=125878 RepID=UPI00085428B5|nr:PREDICTED: adhesion G protein-coupled receptor F5-like [Nanorana parkeri]
MAAIGRNASGGIVEDRTTLDALTANYSPQYSSFQEINGDGDLSALVFLGMPARLEQSVMTQGKSQKSGGCCHSDICGMRHKMHFVWIFILTLMAAGVTPTNGTPESWGFSQILSHLTLLNLQLIGWMCPWYVRRSSGSDGVRFEPELIPTGSPFIFFGICSTPPKELQRKVTGVDQVRKNALHCTECEWALNVDRLTTSAGMPVSEYILDVEISIPDPALAVLIKDYLTKELSLPLSLGTGDTNITRINVTTSCNQTGSNVQCSCESGYQWSSDVCSTYTQCPGASACSCITGTSFPPQYCQALTVNINLSLKLVNEFTPDLQDQNSAKYKQYKHFLENQFNTTYRVLSGFKSATITGFRPGSVIVDYTVVAEPTTPDAINAANQAVISDLSGTNYTAASVSTVVPGWGSISVSPSGIFLNDTVNLTCRVNVSAFSDVSWYINDSEKISNTSNWSYSITSFAGGLQSVLKIEKASVNNSGTYRCDVDVNTNTYTAETTIQIWTLEINKLNSNVNCDSSNVPVMQCCTKDGNVTFNLTCQKTSGNIDGFTVWESSLPCQTYTIAANSQQCSSTKTADYRCTCKTYNGALLSQDITITYQIPPPTIHANITASADRISEWNSLSLTCKCDTINVQSMAWNLIRNDQSANISTANYISNLTNCTSVLTIPSNSLSVNWDGIFICQVNGNNTANKTISVFRRAKTSEIARSPVNIGFSCKSAIDFSCCVDDMKNYHSDATVLHIYKSGNLTNIIAACTKLLPNTSLNIGEVGKDYTIPCNQLYPDQEGNIIYRCNTNGEWERMTDTCVSKALNNLNTMVEGLSSSPVLYLEVPKIISSLNNTVSQDQNITNSVNNIQLVLNILQQTGSAVRNVSTPVMAAFLDTVSVVVDNTRTSTWDRIPNKVNESSNLMQSVESFAEKLKIEDDGITIDSKNVQLKGNKTGSSSSNFRANFDFSQVNNLTGNVLINQTILKSLPNNTNVVSLAYATLNDIIGVPHNSSSNQTLNGLVMTTVLSNNYTKFEIGMDFKKSNSSLNIGSCVWWNFKIQDWDNSGCSFQNYSESVRCVCDHLTSFSILMSLKELDPEIEKILSYITFIGVGISMLSLLICIIVEAIVWKSVTKNKTSYLRHVCIINIAVTLLMADIWFIIGAAMNTTDKVQGCITATFFTHLFYLCVFFWMLTMGLILFYRLMCVFHDLSKTTMMGISFFLGYGCPVIITVITVAVTQPQNAYLMPKSCWLNIEKSKAFLAFIVPALTILLVNFVTLVVVIIKVLRPSVGDRPKKEEKSSLNHIAKCILILTPLLGLTWGLGIGTMVSQSPVIHGFFAGLNSLQGLFILLFGCLMDKKVRDALFSRFSISRWSSQQTKTSNLSSTDPVAPKGVFNLFAKKGAYNISSAQVNSSDLASSNSYSLLT